MYIPGQLFHPGRRIVFRVNVTLVVYSHLMHYSGLESSSSLDNPSLVRFCFCTFFTWSIDYGIDFHSLGIIIFPRKKRKGSSRVQHYEIQ